MPAEFPEPTAALGSGYAGDVHSRMHGRMLLLNENVMAFGAVVDGLNDCTTPIEEAIDELGAAGGLVMMPPGRLPTTRTIDIPSKVTIGGSGDWVTQIEPAVGIGPCFSVEADTTGLRDLRIQGQYSIASGDYGVHFSGIHNGHAMRNVSIRHTGDSGLRFDEFYEYRGWNIGIIDTLGDGINFDGTTNGANDNEFHGLFFGPMATNRCINFRNAQGNRFFGVGFQSPPTNVEWVRFLSPAAKANLVVGLTAYDSLNPTGALACVVFDGATENVLHDVELGFASAKPILRFVNSAIGNIVSGRYAGNPSGLYYADASSTANAVKDWQFSPAILDSGSSILTSHSGMSRSNDLSNVHSLNLFSANTPQVNAVSMNVYSIEAGSKPVGTAMGISIDGEVNGMPSVRKMLNVAGFVGLMQTALTGGGTATVVTHGLAQTTLDTSGSSAGAAVYLSDATPGALTLTPPDIAIMIGQVQTVDNPGVIYVNPPGASVPGYVQQVLATGAGATADNIITALQAIGLVKQS